jgi:hypothetical protein
MSEPMHLWMPAIGAAVAGALLYGYAIFTTRRFDRRAREARSENAAAEVAEKIASPKAATRSQEAYSAARRAVYRTASAGAEQDTPPKK